MTAAAQFWIHLLLCVGAVAEGAYPLAFAFGFSAHLFALVWWVLRREPGPPGAVREGEESP